MSTAFPMPTTSNPTIPPSPPEDSPIPLPISNLSLTDSHTGDVPSAYGDEHASTTAQTVNGTSITNPSTPLQLSLPLPHTFPPTRIHMHLTIRPRTLQLFLTTRTSPSPALPVSQGTPAPSSSNDIPTNTNTTSSTTAAAADLLSHPLAFPNHPNPDPSLAPTHPAEIGSLVVATPPPGRSNSSGSSIPIATALYVREASLDTATRIAKILATKTGRVCTVGSSMDFGTGGMGGSVQEVMVGIREVVRVVAVQVGRWDERWGSSEGR